MARPPTALELRIIEKQYPDYGLLPQRQQQQILREVHHEVQQREAQRAAKRAEAREKARAAERAMLQNFIEDLRVLVEQHDLLPQTLEPVDDAALQATGQPGSRPPKSKRKSSLPKCTKSPNPKKQGSMPKPRRTKGARKSSHWRH